MNTAIKAGVDIRGPYAKSNQSLIARLRLKQGLTQPACAKFCGVSLRTFQRAESGDVVARFTKRKIERALGVAW